MNLGPVAAPLAGLFGAGVWLRRLAYDRGWLSATRAPLRVVSVGGLEVGGSGKTPVTGLLLCAFHLAGQRPGLLTRGYGRRARGLVLRLPGEPADPATLGDEPAMLVGALDLPVAVCADRRQGAAALQQLGCGVAVLDDAFAHRALARELDLVVLRGEAPFGNGHLLPWGSLREPPTSLRRAQVVWLHHRRQAPSGVPPVWLAALAPGATWVESRAAPGAVTDLAGVAQSLAGRRVLAACALARPDDFVASVAELGAEVVGRAAFRDHYAYPGEAVARLAARADALGVDAVVTSAKDAVKLGPHWAGRPLWSIATRVQIFSDLGSLAQRLEIEEKYIAAAMSSQR